jgi:DNA-directed RNA polymerase
MNASANPHNPSSLDELLYGNREKQRHLEKEMLDTTRFARDVRELQAKDRQAEVNTVGGLALYRQAVPKVSRGIQEKLEEKKKGRILDWKKLLLSLLPHAELTHSLDAVAGVTMFVLLNSLRRRRSYQDVAITIGTNLMVYFLPDALGTQDGPPPDQQVPPWSEDNKCKVGMELIKIVVETTGLFQIEEEKKEQAGPKKPLRVIAATRYCYDELLRHEEFYTYASPHHWPMVCLPEQWSSMRGGGYLDERLQQRHPLVQLHTPHQHQRQTYPLESLGNACEAVNLVQSSGYRINRWLLEQINTAIARRVSIDGLPAIDIDYDSPATSETMDRQTLLKAQQVKKQEQLRSYKKAANKKLGDFPSESNTGESDAQRRRRQAQWAEEKRGIVSRLVAKRLVLQQAEKFKDEPELFLPCFLDFRGRLYYHTLLHPQSTLGKALLEAASGKVIENEKQAEWLAIHVANTYGRDGLDKKPYEERKAWVRANDEMIRRVADDPYQDKKTIEEWTQADSPLEFLAACNEYHRFRRSGLGYDSHLIVYMDGTCNGLQHLAAMTGDEAGGREVNLVPDEVPRDIYAKAWQKCERPLEDFAVNGTEREKDLATRWKRVGGNRRLVKPVVMCLPYGLTVRGAIKQLEVELDQMQSDGNDTLFDDLSRKDRYEAIRWFYELVLKDAIKDVTSMAEGTMDCLRDMAAVIGKAGKEIEWRTHDGFCVRQSYYKSRSLVASSGRGKSRLTATVRVPTNKLDANNQKNRIVPNFVHSMDATAMRLYVRRAAKRGISMFAMIHDCFGCHVADVPIMHECIRESFVELYRDGTVLSNLRSDWVASLPAAQAEAMSKVSLPPYGSLNIDGVLGSDYFFM